MILIFNLYYSIAHLDEWFKEKNLASHMSRQYNDVQYEFRKLPETKSPKKPCHLYLITE